MSVYHFLVLGSERRQRYLAELLRERGHDVREAGFFPPGKVPSEEVPPGHYDARLRSVPRAEENLPGHYDAALLPVPETEKYLRANLENFQAGQKIYGCNFPVELLEECGRKGLCCIDYMKAEGVASKNAIATAEGAIAEALKGACVSIHGSRALVAGYGRCGEVLADKLLSLRAEVTALDRKGEKRAKAAAHGCQALSFEEAPNAMGQFDYIFNTIPAPVLTESLLRHIKKEAVIIDIASRPGGVDYSYCEKRGINARLCLGLPGKYAPKSAAQILLEVIEKTIAGR